MSILTFTDFMQSEDSHSTNKWFDYLISWQQNNNNRGVWADEGMDTHVRKYMGKVNNLYGAYFSCLQLNDQRWVRKIHQAFENIVYKVAIDLAKHAKGEVLITKDSNLPGIDEFVKIANAAIRCFRSKQAKTTARTKAKKRRYA